MKSINKELGFSFEDFEKGLMLAGYIMPKNVQEYNEREALENYEKENKPKNVYFKRVVLAAEIAYQLNNEPTLGRIKFQKLVYLCENAARMNLEGRYQKQAAGPFDNRFMHTIANEFKKNNWFAVEEVLNTGYKRSKYVPLENSEGYKKYYENYFGSTNERIQYIIQLFRKMSTDNTELATTVFACHLELNARGREISWDELKSLFYSWSDKKRRFAEKDVYASYEWLRSKGLL